MLKTHCIFHKSKTSLLGDNIHMSTDIPLPQFFIDRINTIISVTQPPIYTLIEAKAWIKQLVLMQKHLRLLKKEINVAQKQIRNYAKEASQTAQHGFFTMKIGGALLGKQRMKSINASSKREASNSALQYLEPYEAIEQKIDQLLVKIDSDKISLDSWIVQNKSNL